METKPRLCMYVLLLALVASFHTANCQCYQNNLELSADHGRIDFASEYDTYCEWTLQNDTYLASSALLVYIESVDMTYYFTDRAVYGYLLLPDITINRRTEPYCKIYVKLGSKCDLSKIQADAIRRHPDCDKMSVFIAKDIRAFFSFQAGHDFYKSFSLKFRFYSCDGTSVHAIATPVASTVKTETLIQLPTKAAILVQDDSHYAAPSPAGIDCSIPTRTSDLLIQEDTQIRILTFVIIGLAGLLLICIACFLILLHKQRKMAKVRIQEAGSPPHPNPAFWKQSAETVENQHPERDIVTNQLYEMQLQQPDEASNIYSSVHSVPQSH